jgi:outer membrane protein
MKIRVISACFVTILLMGTAMTAAAADAVKLAYVDLRRALNETTEGKAAMDKLAKLKDKLQVKIESDEKKIMDMKSALEKQQDILTKDAMQKKVEEYYKSVNELQESYMRYQKELSAKEAELTQGILAKMETILSDIGQTEGYTMIFDRSSGSVVWGPAHLDLTDKLIQKYNIQYKGGGAGAAPTPKKP